MAQIRQGFDTNRNKSDCDLRSKTSPKYLLEHLATFTVGNESGILSPADGMRRLLQLEKSTGIWSQKMQLSVDDEWVFIIDYDSGTIIERFPTTLIKDPTAFTSSDCLELYNNILIFIVSGNNTRSEMHIFQSQSIPAVELVEIFKLTSKPKSENDGMKNLIRNRNENDKQNQESNYRFFAKTKHFKKESIIHDESDNENGPLEESNSFSGDMHEKDVAVLNHCFDDIEKFIARLQHAAAATRELERRRKQRKTKKKDLGDGLLSLRTKPPHEKEFLDIFSKFKLSFNLLAKLKSHIHDPNAPELVHFLFTPLALIVESASETYFEQQLPSQVVNPLLTREAINLLINCVTSKETELWRSLGDTWIIPRDQWKESLGSYHPVFLDGWSPDFIIVDESNSPVGNKKNSSRLNPLHHSTHNDETDSDALHTNENYKIVLESSRSMANSFDTVESINLEVPIANTSRQENVNSIFNLENLHIDSKDESPTKANEQLLTSWLKNLQDAGAKIVQVTYPRTANNDKELTVTRGEFLEVLDDTRKWWKARNIYGEVAHVPHTIIAPYNSHDKDIIFPTNNRYNSSEKILDGENFLELRAPNKKKQFGQKGEFRYF